MSHHMIIFIILDARCVVTMFCVYCLCNAIHCMGQNIKSLAGVSVCVLVCAHGFWGRISRKRLEIEVRFQ